MWACRSPNSVTNAEPVHSRATSAATGRSWLRSRALGIDILAVIASGSATGLLGFIFWTLAARGYTTAEVGRASAIINSAVLIATLATLSLGSLYERFLPVAGFEARRYVRSGLTVVTAAALIFGAIFILVGPREYLFHGVAEALSFPVFVAILAIFAIQDQVLVGLGRTRTILSKNVGQATVKLVAVCALIPLATGSAIVWSWVAPAAVIAALVTIRVIRPTSRRHDGEPQLPPRRDLMHFFVSAYAMNSLLVLVPLVLPLVIVARLGTEMNAYFSMCWLLVTAVTVIVAATAAPFIATASAPGADLRACTLRFTVMCGGSALAGSVALFLAGPQILWVMGPEYAREGGHLIRMMALALPLIAVLQIYAAMAKLRRKLKVAVVVQLLSGILIVGGVAFTTPIWGINAVAYTYLVTELLCATIVAIPTIRIFRQALRADLPEVEEPPLHSVEAVAQPADRPLDYRSVTEHFEATVRDQPDRVAFRDATDAITYRQLSNASAQWAAMLDAPGHQHVTLLSSSLSPGTVAAVLGVFASNSVLVAVDPGLPAARVHTVVEILSRNGWRAQTLITDDPDGQLPGAVGANCRVMPTALPTGSGPRGTAGHPSDVDDLTSIQFTSGSSGLPKAVRHGNGMWLCDAQLMSDRLGIRSGCRVALCMPISFGAGLNVLIGSLLNGAEVIAIDPRTESPRAAFERIGDVGAQVIVSTPAFLDALCTAAAGDQLPSLERVVTTGEAAHSRHLQHARSIAPRAVLTNWMGSSEASSIATFDVAPGGTIPDGAIPAGIPSPHKHIELDPDGAVSVTSRYLALGYLDPTMSDSTFTDNPDGTRTFRSGDIGRRDDAGNLILLGRSDTAVKIKGYLVEPAEVEAALLRHPEVREAFVVASPKLAAGDGNSPELTCYMAPMPNRRAPSVSELRNRLHRDLPPWMVPTHLVMLTELPRTERGKVDRQALPLPTRAASEPPRGKLEAAIAEIWAEVLQLAEVGRTESFYALGGDSLTGTQMLVRVGDQHGVRLSHTDLASAPTIAQFATTLTARTSAQLPDHRQRLAPTTVPIRPGTSDDDTAVLFCFTGAGASALSFVPLADRTDPATPVCAFIPAGLESRALPDWTIARAAKRHLVDLRRLQPHGPYTLVGHSLGGYIALEVARQLESSGERVELVTLLDPFLPPATARAARRELIGGKGRPTPNHGVVEKSRAEVWRDRLRLPLAGLIQFRGERQAKALEAVGVRVGQMHRPRPWGGRALLILSDLNPDEPALWSHLLTGELTVEVFACDHNSIVREPYVSEVADLMSAHRSDRQPPQESVSSRISASTP